MPSKYQTPTNAGLLIILHPNDTRNEKYVLLIESPRGRARNESCLELPKGTLNASGGFTGPVMDHMRQETGLKLVKEDLINLNALIKRMPPLIQPTQGLRSVAATRAINADPNRPLFLWEKTWDREEIEDWRGKYGDRRVLDEAGNIRMLVYKDFCEERIRKAELMDAWAMYETLNARGDLRELRYDARLRVGN